MNNKTYLVEDLLKVYAEKLSLRLIAGREGIKRPVRVAEIDRPGLSLAGYLKGYNPKRILVFGPTEIEYLQELKPEVRVQRLERILTPTTPAVLLTNRLSPLKELYFLCEKLQVPLLQSGMKEMKLMSRLTILLVEELALSITCHGTLVEVFGVGVLIQGESSVGKSESALGLIKRGHRLISDDIVMVKKKGDSYLEGSGAELTRHHMEIRSIGIINVAHLYGAICVRDKKSIDLIVQLEVWKEESFYDRVGLDEKHSEMLGVRLPLHILPVKPGRDVVLLLETMALNHRLKEMGYHAAKDFDAKLLNILSDRSDADEDEAEEGLETL